MGDNAPRADVLCMDNARESDRSSWLLMEGASELYMAAVRSRSFVSSECFVRNQASKVKEGLVRYVVDGASDCECG